MRIWKSNTNLLVFITNSLGELDFLLPVLCKERDFSSLTIVFTKKTAYEKFKQSYPYEEILTSLNARIIHCFIDDRGNKYRPLFLLGVWWRFFNWIRKSDTVQLEQAGGRAVGRMIVSLSFLMRKRILIHPHAVNIEVGIIPKVRTRFVTSFPILLSDDRLLEVYRQQGFHKFVKSGFPKFFSEWRKELAKYQKNGVKPGYALFFTRPPDKIWMPQDQYRKLVSESIATFRKYFPLSKIVFKLHPREQKEFLIDFLQSLGCDNYEISEENSMFLARNCLLTVGYFTSAVYDAYSHGKPAIDFYIETEEMKKYYPRGRSNRLLKMDYADNQNELDAFVRSVANSTYRLPQPILDLFGEEVEFLPLPRTVEEPTASWQLQLDT